MKNNTFKQKNFSVLIGLIMGIFLLYFFLPINNYDNNFEDFALDEDTKTSKASLENKKIHCSDLSDLNLCIDGYIYENKKNSVIIWLGNSQLHAINQYKPGDETIAPKIHKLLKKYDYYTLVVSQPNANMQEHYILFAYLLENFPIKNLILPVVFDDMREDELRINIKNILNEKKYLEIIKQTSTGIRLISKHENKNLAKETTNILKDTRQNKFEISVNENLEKIWPLWNNRDILRGQLLGKLYLLRNSIFGIKATSTRKMIRGRYIKNKNAYIDILNLALDNNVEVLVYIPPIRNDIKIPYDLTEYTKFKNEIEAIAYSKKAFFINLEELVPSKFWGIKPSTNLKGESEIDFMHFQTEGHSLLADAIFKEINKIFKLKKNQ